MIEIVKQVQITALIILGLSTVGQAQGSNAEFAPPGKPEKQRYEAIWNNSPFELEAAPDKVIAQTMVSQNDFFLAGVMQKGDKYLVYIQNRKTGEVVKASDSETTSGFRVREVIKGAGANDYEARVEHQGRALTLAYDRKAQAAISRVTNAQAQAKAKPQVNPAQMALEMARKKAAESKVKTPKTGGVSRRQLVP